MKVTKSVLILVGVFFAGVRASPVSKVLDLLSGLHAKITEEGEKSKKQYEEFMEWCEDRSKNLGFEIKTGEAEVAELKATIEQETGLQAALATKIDNLASSNSAAEADLKAATGIREKEASDFEAESKELTEIISMLERAIGILEREMRKGGASALQLQHATTVTQALSAMVQASVFSSADASRLTALVQSAQASKDDGDDDELGAPAAAVYEGHSSGIVDTLEGLLEKAQEQLDKARKAETNARHNFEMLKQSLEDEMKFGGKEMAEAKANLAASGEKTAVAEGDLDATTNELKDDQKSKTVVETDCMTRAQDYEAEVKGRTEEIKALSEARKIIAESTGGADDVTYGQTSLLQIGRATILSGADLAHYEAVRLVRDLARKQGSAALAQLAERMATAMRLGTGAGEDPFAKVKGMIKDMIERLEGEGSADASHKAYCDKELSETTSKKTEKDNEIEKLSTKIEQMKAQSAKLKEEVAALMQALAKLVKADVEMKTMRQKEHESFVTNKADLEQGLEGVRMAVKILREYYASGEKAQGAAEGAANGIVGMLEIVESDFSKGIAEATATEDTAQASFEQQEQANKIEKATKEQDVKYKEKESASLDKTVSEATNDRTGVQAELDAVLEYLEKLKEACIAKPETYTERAARRGAEIAGLKEALQILQGDAALLQRGARRSLRALRHHGVA